MPADLADQIAAELAAPEVDADAKKRFLTALAQKGETAPEVAALAQAFRKLSLDPGVADLADDAIDIVGTGGDKSGSFNISSLTSIMTAVGGVRVMKHGNRSITSKSGSADFLAGLGIDLGAPAEVQRQSLEELGYCFFFAPAYHPAFKEIVPVRKALAAEGQRTVFNLLGPLINPGRPSYQLMGVFAKEWVKPLADALHQIGLKRGFVVHCALSADAGMDELSTAGDNHVAGFGEFHGQVEVWKPEDIGLARCDKNELAGGSPEENQQLLKDILAGTAPSGLIDTICLNTGCALWIAGKTDSLKAGIEAARAMLKEGAVSEWLTRARAFYEVRNNDAMDA